MAVGKLRGAPRWARWLAILIVASAALGGLVYVNRQTLSYVMARWTGEEELREQLKGTAALAYLQLTRSSIRLDPMVPIAHTGLSPYGVNTFLEQEADQAKVDESLRLVAEAGLHWIRQEFPWEDIEISAKGDFWDHKWDVSAWAKYDRIVDLAEEHGLEIIARLDNPPAWSRAKGNAPGWAMAPPDDLRDFGDFVYQIVSRYRGRIRHYQIWNEPNIFPEWGDQPADPVAYTELLKIAYERAKSADPECVIVAAGLAQTTEETPPEFGPRNMSDLLYLEQMYQADAKDSFDVMGAMVYGLWTAPYDRRASRDRTNFSRPQLLREIMVRHGDGGKPIWATEVGWSALPLDFPGNADYGRVTEGQQATYAAEAYRRAAREWPWMGVMNYWYLRRPSDAEINQSWYYFRMIEPDFTPLPVYAALSYLAQQPPTMQIGYHQQDHWALHYEGPWQHIRDEDAVLGAYALGTRTEGLEDPTLAFHFEGTHLSLALRDPRQLDSLEIRIDDREVRPLRSWTAPISGNPAFAVARHLSDSRHLAELRVSQGSVALDGIIVSRTNRVPPWIPLTAIALVGIAGVYAARRRRG